MSKKYPELKDMNLWQEYSQDILNNPSRRSNFRPYIERYPTILDLHGFTIDEGYKILQTFIIKNFTQNSRTVLVITGNNKNGQTFKNKVPRWLKESPFTSYITSFKNAPPSQGGEGALVIELKKNK